MSAKPLRSDLPIHTFATASDLLKFLDRSHATSPGFYLKLAKKTCGMPSVSSAEALDIALCYGWINGRGNGLDDNWYLARYTPRRPKSIWSKINVESIGRLDKAGRMHPAGLAAVEAAKTDGRWERAYAQPSAIEQPRDFTIALEASPAAAAFFESMNKTNRYAVLWRLETCSPQTRARRIQDMVQMLSEGKLFHPPANSRGKRTMQGSQAGQTVEKTSLELKGRKRPAQDDGEVIPRRAGLRSGR